MLQDKADPLATILSIAMLLRYGFGKIDTAVRIEAAVLHTVNNGSAGNVYIYLFFY